MRLIDADKLLLELNKLEPRSSNQYIKQGLDDALHYYMPQILDEQSTIDAVPVVRCKDCIFSCEPNEEFKYFHCINAQWDDYDGWARGVDHNDFCSYGERKDGETNANHF